MTRCGLDMVLINGTVLNTGGVLCTLAEGRPLASGSNFSLLIPLFLDRSFLDVALTLLSPIRTLKSHLSGVLQSVRLPGMAGFNSMPTLRCFTLHGVRLRGD